MAALPVRLPAPLELPYRVRCRQSSPSDGESLKATLAARILRLPQAEMVGQAADGHQFSVSIFPGQFRANGESESPRVSFIHWSMTGLDLEGLSDSDRYRILSRGWGTLKGASVILHFPRDPAELEVCWRIVERAHASLLSRDPSLPATRRMIVNPLPAFSRTNLS